MIKVLIIGDSGVGKTSLLLRHTDKIFISEQQNTIGVELKSTYQLVKGERVYLQIWDTAGQERYRALTKPYYRGAKAAIIVFDLNKHESFAHVREWIAELSRSADKDCIIILVGNKSDLEHHVTQTEINKLLETTMINQYMQASAKDNKGIGNIFQTVAELAYYISQRDSSDTGQNNAITLKKASTIELDSEDPSRDSKNCCLT